MKKCISCHKTFPLESFYKDRTKKDGHRANCKSCQKHSNRLQYEKRKENIKCQVRVHRENKKTCTRCHKTFPLESFYKHKGGKYGVAPICKACDTLRVQEWRAKNPEKTKLYCANWRAKNPEYDAYGKVKKWRAENPEARKEQNKRHYRKHKKQYAAKVAKRKAALLNRTPSWADQTAIAEIYKNCPKNYEVDHIIPLQGKNVSGLHVEANLRMIPRLENRTKHAKWMPSIEVYIP